MAVRYRRLGKLLFLAAAVCLILGVLARKFLGFGRALPDVPFLDPKTRAPEHTQYRTFHSNTINGDASYLVYLPPDYDASPDKRYPVIYWLHGLGGNPRGGEVFVQQLDAAIRSGETPQMIAVMVNGLEYSRYYDSKDGKMPVESVFIKDLIPHVDATYRTIAARQGRALEGFSMGGFGAIRFAFRYPELFCAATSLAGAIRDENGIKGGIGFGSWTPAHFEKVFSGDAEYYRVTSPQVLAVQNVDAIRGRIRIRLIGGALDGQTRATDRFARQLDELAIPYEFAKVPGVGHHQRKMYETLGPTFFHFYRDLFPVK